MICMVDGCERKTRARGLCRLHYEARRRAGVQLADIGPLAVPRHAPLVCVCLHPKPGGLGECQVCHRIVVTYLSGDATHDRERWPTEYDRAVRLGLAPKARIPTDG